MKILVIGAGAREHTLTWKLAQSPKTQKIYCAPGNAGTAQIAENVAIKPDNIEELLNFALQNQIDLTVVGPEAPLVAGISDRFRQKGLKIFGPTAKGAVLEGSKVFAKNFMEKYQIPTARFNTYTDLGEALNDLSNFSLPLVVKANGLAAGKGVLICDEYTQAEEALKDMMKNQKFGDAGKQVVIEEFLEGTEASLLCFVAGNKLFPMQSARDYKKAFDNDKGLNTGGMGCFSPNTVFSPDVQEEIRCDVLEKTETGLKNEGIDFRGVLFIGLMITKMGVSVLEYNVRLGDPETQVVLPRLESDLVEMIEKTIDGTLKTNDLQWSKKACVTVIAASGGYPGTYQKGKPISGIDQTDDSTMIFHAGTKVQENQIVTSGGRVLAVTALGESIAQARNRVYHNIKKINFEGMFYRRDIAKL